LTATGLAAFVGGLELITYGGTAWVVIAVTLCVGAVLLGGAVLHLCRSAHPLLDLRLFRIPTFRVTNSGGSCFRMAISAAPFLLPLLFQEVFGWNPLEAGLIVGPIFVGNIGVKPFTSWLLRRFGFRTVLVTSGSAIAITLGLCAAFRPGFPLAITLVVLFASGVSRSVGFTAYNTIVFADVPADEVGNANTLTSTVQQLSTGLGVTAGALALHAAAPIGRLLDTSGRGAEPFTVAFVLIALLALVAAVESARLPGHAGLVLTGPRPGTGARG
jgi:MFS family permease